MPSDGRFLSADCPNRGLCIGAILISGNQDYIFKSWCLKHYIDLDQIEQHTV